MKKVGLISVNAGASTRTIDAMNALATAPYINLSVSPVTVAVGGIFAGAFNENGELVSEEAQASLQNFINAYAEFIA